MKKILPLIVGLLGLATVQGQEPIEFTATLDGADAVPFNANYAFTGFAQFSLTGSNLSFEITFRRDFAFMAQAWVEGPSGHFIFDLGTPQVAVHSPGVPGQPFDPGATFYHGAFTAPESAIKDLLAGRLYLNLLPLRLFGDNAPIGSIRARILPTQDSDHDGVPDYLDECPNTPAGAIVDASGCSIDQLCPCDAPWKNHGQYVRAIEHVSKQFRKEGLITKEQQQAIVTRAANSDCGKRRR